MKKNWKKYLPIAGAAIVLVLIAIVTIPVNAKTVDPGTIPERVYFGEVSVGGMTQEEAVTAVEEYVEGLKDKVITLQAGENTVEASVSELGLEWNNSEIVEEAVSLGKSGNLIERYKAMKDLENEDKVYQLSYRVDRDKLTKVLEENESALNTEAVDAGLTREDGKFTIIPGSQGVTVNVEESVNILEKYFSTEWKEEDAAVEIAADVVEPKGTEEELSKVQDLLGSFHTDYSTSAAGRSTNVANGTSRINGSVIYPGDTFSVYEAVSPFDAEHGYELAGSYENGTTVETYGGGICQVSTTLYNAVIRAELEIVERFNHSMIVSYVDPSADAAIAGTYKDLKFKNNTDAPIYIEGYTAGKVVYFNIFGQETRPENREVSFVSETISTTDPGVQYQAAADLPIGQTRREQSAHTGYVAQLWKIVKVDGVEQSREVFNKSTYRPSPKIVAVGVASANGDAVNAINAAIATQDEATINAAMAQWNDEALAQAAQAAEQQQPQQPELPVVPDGTDPNAGTDPNTGTDPNAGTGSNTGTDPNGETSTGEGTTPNP